MAESSESSELSKMSDLSNDDADRRSPSRFGSDFILKPPEPFRNDVSNKTSSHRMNKSATMLTVNATQPVGRKKSHSASFVQKNQEKLLLSPNYRSKTRESEDKTQNKKYIEDKIATPKETTRRRTPVKKNDRQPDVQEDITLNYQALIKEKTKLILEKQKTQLKDEQKSSAHAQKAKSPNLPKILSKSVTTRAFEVQNDDSLQTDSSELDTSEFITKFREDFMQNVVITQNQLNWCALKRALYEDTPDVKMKLLQALRWRLTDCNSSQREAQLLEYVKNDILSINSIPPHGQLFLESFYCPKKMVTPHPLQEEMARFINTLASLSMGRLYLERDESLLSVMLLPLLMGKLPGIKIYDLTREFTMATVQKLSLSNKMREVMINAGVMEWLILFIEKNHHKMTTYEAEYSTALLTNLCINKEARSRCERVADRVVTVIDDLIDTPHKCCLPYINPILYSLLLNPVINDRAVSNGIGVKLKQLYNVYENNIELSKQLDAIIAMHEARDFCECDDADTEDVTNQNHADYLEQELSLRDPIYHTPMGEELLKLFYNRIAPSSGRFLNIDNEIKHPSLVQIVKKSCVCNNKSLSKLEHRLLSEETAQNPIEAVKINKWQNRPTYRKRTDTPIPNRNNHNLNSKPISNKIPNKTSNKLTKSRNEVKLGARQRSKSQPPARKHKPITTKTENLKKTERIKMIPMNDANNSLNNEINTENPSPKQYILNCCLKMDYMNAIAAPPGEYRPQPLHTSSPNLNSHTDDNYVEFKKLQVLQ
ncbi:uncharacterized protein [Atheta coriaria]|uniref:uncharacterized protein n=1 Tax=Dalotia coriaria TaxID=877792 RepID=UPI0031F4339B